MLCACVYTLFLCARFNTTHTLAVVHTSDAKEQWNDAFVVIGIGSVPITHTYIFNCCCSSIHISPKIFLFCLWISLHGVLVWLLALIVFVVAVQLVYWSLIKCIYFSNYTCTQCGSRFCSIKCNSTHKETRCLKLVA